MNIVKTTTGLSPTNIKDHLPSNTSNREVINAIIDNYREHPSIQKINEFSKHVEPFSLNFVCQNEVNKYLKNVNVNKSIGEDKLPPKILQISANVIDKPLMTVINVSISEMTFPNQSKNAAVVPIFKSEDKIDKKNYRPVSILNSVSKIFENVIKDQVTPFFDTFLSIFVTAYRQSYSSQHVLLRLIEDWRYCLDQSKLVGIILMDLSKAFDCILHHLLIAKLNAYGVDSSALTYIYSYMKERKQAVRLNETYSMYMDIVSGVPAI